MAKNLQPGVKTTIVQPLITDCFTFALQSNTLRLSQDPQKSHLNKASGSRSGSHHLPEVQEWMRLFRVGPSPKDNLFTLITEFIRYIYYFPPLAT